jgi:hypothetical protein
MMPTATEMLLCTALSVGCRIALCCAQQVFHHLLPHGRNKFAHEEETGTLIRHGCEGGSSVFPGLKAVREMWLYKVTAG